MWNKEPFIVIDSSALLYHYVEHTYRYVEHTQPVAKSVGLALLGWSRSHAENPDAAKSLSNVSHLRSRLMA
jgi:hypothetical protein